MSGFIYRASFYYQWPSLQSLVFILKDTITTNFDTFHFRKKKEHFTNTALFLKEWNQLVTGTPV